MEYEQSVKWQFFEKKTIGQTTFFQKKKKTVKLHFCQMTIFRKVFSQMNFQSNDHFQLKLSVKWLFGQATSCAFFFFSQMTFFVQIRFGQITILWKKSVKWPFGKINLRSNGVRLNGDSAKRIFGQTAFGQMVFRSNSLSVKWCSVKWCFGQCCGLTVFG
jgi:hypothetical protein